MSTAWTTARRKAAANRLHAIGTDCYDIASNILGAGPRAEDPAVLAEAARTLAALARELAFFHTAAATDHPAEGKESSEHRRSP